MNRKRLKSGWICLEQDPAAYGDKTERCFVDVQDVCSPRGCCNVVRKSSLDFTVYICTATWFMACQHTSLQCGLSLQLAILTRGEERNETFFSLSRGVSTQWRGITCITTAASQLIYRLSIVTSCGKKRKSLGPPVFSMIKNVQPTVRCTECGPRDSFVNKLSFYLYVIL